MGAAVEVSKWTETVTADNGAATVTHAAEAGKAHYITSLHLSFSTAQTAAKLATLKDGTTVIGNFHCFSVRDVVFAKPIRITQGALAELSLPASGTGTQVGAATLCGFTLGA